VYNDYGFLQQVKQRGGSGTVYWAAESCDARANLTGHPLGNGLRARRGFSLTGLEAVVAEAGAGFAGGHASTLLNGGSIGDAFKAGVKGGITGAISAGVAYGIGQSELLNTRFSKGVAHGAAQGLLTEAQGGEFQHGFVSTFVRKMASGPISETIGGGTPGQVAAAAIVGGTTSELAGGKFANGAASAAFTYLFNEATSGEGEQKARSEEDPETVGVVSKGYRKAITVTYSGSKWTPWDWLDALIDLGRAATGGQPLAAEIVIDRKALEVDQVPENFELIESKPRPSCLLEYFTKPVQGSGYYHNHNPLRIVPIPKKWLDELKLQGLPSKNIDNRYIHEYEIDYKYGPSEE